MAMLEPTIVLGAAATFGITLMAVFVRLVLLHLSRGSSRRFFHARDLDDEALKGTLDSADRQLLNVVEEMANMMSASRAYQNNVEVINAARQMMGGLINGLPLSRTFSVPRLRVATSRRWPRYPRGSGRR